MKAITSFVRGVRRALLDRDADLVVITLLALAVRMIGLGWNAAYGDELFSIQTASQDVADLVMRLWSDSHPPLYFLVLRAWGHLFGHSDTAARLLSALLGAAAVLPLHRLIRRWLDPVGARVGSLLLALSPFQLFYAQEARGYTMLLCASLCALWLAIRLAQSDTLGAAVGYVGSVVAAAYTHNLGAITFVVCNIVHLLELVRSGRRWTRRWMAAQAACVLLLLPVVCWGGAQLLWNTRTSRFPELDTGRLAEIFLDLSGTTSASVSAAIWSAALAGVGVGLLTKRCRLVAAQLGLWLLLHYVAVLAVSFWLVPVSFGSRHLIQASPVLYCGVALLHHLLRGRLLRWLLLAAVFLLPLPSLWRYYTVPSKTDWIKAAEIVASQMRQRDRIVVANYDWMDWQFARYFRSDDRIVSVKFLGEDAGDDLDPARGRASLRGAIAARDTRRYFVVLQLSEDYLAVNRVILGTMRVACAEEQPVAVLGDGGSLSRRMGYYNPLEIRRFSDCTGLSDQ